MNDICRGCGTDAHHGDGLCSGSRGCFVKCLAFGRTKTDLPLWLMTPDESMSKFGNMNQAMRLHPVLIDSWLEAGQP